jgi:hypothetical protein
MESQPEISEPSKEPSIAQERLNWKLACRDDAKIAQGLYAGEEIEEMHELSVAGLLDEFFVFEANCPPRRVMRAAASSSKPAG